MKKIFISLILASVCSCSADKDTIEQVSVVAIPQTELEAMYMRMVTSEEYKKLDAAESAYFDKMNIFTVYPLITDKQLKDGGLRWIKRHLAETKFASVEEAEKEHEEILALLGEVLKNHHAVYDAYGNEANHKTLSELSRKYDQEYQHN